MGLLLDYIEFGVLYGTLITFILRYRYLNLPCKRLVFHLLNLAIGNTLAIFIDEYLHKSNLFLFHYLTPLEYTALCIVFYSSLESRYRRKMILISIPGFVLLCILLTVYVDELNVNDSIARVVEALLVTIWIFLFLKQLSTTDKILNFKREPLFWVYFGLLLYFWGTLFVQGLLNSLNTLEKTLANQIYTVQYIFEYTSLIAINIGLFCHRIFKRPETGENT